MVRSFFLYKEILPSFFTLPKRIYVLNSSPSFENIPKDENGKMFNFAHFCPPAAVWLKWSLPRAQAAHFLRLARRGVRQTSG
jgi:hypothetical protein